MLNVHSNTKTSTSALQKNNGKMNPESSMESNPPYGIIEQACQVLMNA